MRVFIICSKKFYPRIPDIKEKLERLGHLVILPNCYDKPSTEDEMKALGKEEHAAFKKAMFKQSEKIIHNADAVLVLNFTNHDKQGYIGGATFLEMYDAFRMNKKLFMWNPVASSLISDEIEGFSPIIIDGNIELIK